MRGKRFAYAFAGQQFSFFSMRFRSPLSGGLGAERVHFGTPGGSKFVLSPTRRAIFQRIAIFMKSLSQGGVELFLGSLLGVFLGHFFVLLHLCFSSRFRDPRGDRNFFFGGSVGCGRILA